VSSRILNYNTCTPEDDHLGRNMLRNETMFKERTTNYVALRRRRNPVSY
jgi:hypothetical protein